MIVRKKGKWQSLLTSPATEIRVSSGFLMLMRGARPLRTGGFEYCSSRHQEALNDLRLDSRDLCRARRLVGGAFCRVF
jgi:hypothetical protein